jgi:hypothetical protein
MRLGFFFIALLTCTGASAQLLTGNPYFPQDTSTLTITVNCASGNQGLLNYGDTGVYVHIGVITSASTSSSDWLDVPFTWGTADPAAAATYIAPNTWSYTIHNIRSFFGVCFIRWLSSSEMRMVPWSSAIAMEVICIGLFTGLD